MYKPKEIFLTKGVGEHKQELTSFEMALRSAGISSYNLVKVSSIFPPYCGLISKEEGLGKLIEGQIIHLVYSVNSTNEPGRIVAAFVGIAIPKDSSRYGYISEYKSFGENKRKAGDYAEDLAAEMLATTMGIEIDTNKSYDEQRETWKISGKIVKTSNITQTARGNKGGLWTTVLAAAVFIPPKLLE